MQATGPKNLEERREGREEEVKEEGIKCQAKEDDWCKKERKEEKTRE